MNMDTEQTTTLNNIIVELNRFISEKLNSDNDEYYNISEAVRKLQRSAESMSANSNRYRLARAYTTVDKLVWDFIELKQYIKGNDSEDIKFIIDTLNLIGKRISKVIENQSFR